MYTKALVSLGMLISLSLIDSQPGNDPEHLNLACSSRVSLEKRLSLSIDITDDCVDKYLSF